MSADPQIVKPEQPRRVETKPTERVKLPKDDEKEKIKRQLYNLIDRVDKL